MKLYECDNCNQRGCWPPRVKLDGAVGQSGGILLPEHMMEKHFCSTKCFWKWAKKYAPDSGHALEEAKLRRRLPNVPFLDALKKELDESGGVPG